MKKATIPEEKRSLSQDNSNTSVSAQNSRLAGRMEQGSIDTFAIMRELNICRPGARICDLRNAGYKIITNRIVLTDEWGRTHRGVAVYTLIAKPGVRAAA
ncbi:helix-turn-helix domain-containing protein [Pseudomonas sp. CCI4.2]|uniref:helix-turn-helix domain-containing protein n=1 Tax=Pseudomonas sp. CCI4.2 TaxID=3048620 RepID=UPI002AC8DBFA|nr:helix-turn-helix domain-containing protein [Pseudomonas sp. CCI4.2]MEB0091800.1 helix-turn-helix domain-containing protein [Pseudomonas sp. CCI4.2]WPX54849.1 helix-turn-helix domain-containing protein [Pseudomonas sp. CCI4.2]